MTVRRINVVEGIGAAAAGALVLLIGLAAVQGESRAAAAAARAETQAELDAFRVRLEDEIGDVVSALREAAERYASGARGNAVSESFGEFPYALWRSSRDGFEVLSGPNEARSLYAPYVGIWGELSLFGPVTPVDGRDALIVRAPIPGGVGNGSLGVGVRLDDLWSRTGLDELRRRGINVVIADERGNAIYRSSERPLQEPVSSTIYVAGCRWQLAAEPGAGWLTAVGSWLLLVPVAMLASAYAAAFLAMARRPRRLRDELSTLENRLQGKDSELSAMLHSRYELETRLMTALSVDSATGLPNRHSLLEHLRQRLSKTRVRTAGAPVLVGVIRFWQIDEVGHSMGSALAERLLSGAADRLLNKAGRDVYFARSSEKELAFCLSGADSDPESAANRMLSMLEHPFEIEGRTMFMPAVVGIAMSRDGYAHGSELLNQAMLAADEAVQHGKGWASFRPEAKAERISMLQLEADLHAAVRNRTLQLYVQPIVSVADGGLVGFESVVRWRHPTESWVKPERFIPLAQDIGEMPRITEWVAGECIAHSKRTLGRTGASGPYITLNLMPDNLNRDFCERLFEMLARARVRPDRLRLEVTETAVVRDFRLAARLIKELNERGVRVLLDDFGTGYSSLSYLRDLPFHAVKIDKSFVRGMSASARDFGIVRSIVSLVHYLGMECVAEGVETQEQLDLIELVGCDYWQGYLFTPPVPANRMSELIFKQAAKSARLLPGGA